MGVLGRSDKGAAHWSLKVEEGCAQIVLSEAEMAAAEIAGGPVAGFVVEMNQFNASGAVPDELAERAQVMVVEVNPASDASLRRLATLRAGHPRLPIVAAVRDASIPVVRALLRSGVNDVLGLPLTNHDLAAALERIREDIAKAAPLETSHGKLVTIIKSVGGVGATMLATQAASIHARREAPLGRETCLFDLDLQFGNAATYLGLSPLLTISDLLEAGARVDGDLLRSATIQTGAGLNVIAAPQEIMPLEAVGSDQMFDVVDLALRDYDTVFVDLPGNWTNWSLSLVARSDIVLLVVELTIASLRQAQRQLALLKKQGLGELPIQVIANRVQKKLFRSIDLADASRAIGHPVAFSVANDFPLVGTALDQGVHIDEVKAKSKVAKDIEAILDGCNELLDRGS
ncbi:pilus assembly protein CpaE [Sphingomonas sp. LaA6.9]|uniref:AAA family ATPase n=1 Tax=Sphingomonas sp. LaA6.9 TaxID=2919914 RepID=UPI001F4F9C84|nr:pilus assembly protein CpaE [Sphingomonas sp. LaA6.9]MCJ8158062.1 pilus assembly protein CpaE [Sphingomonas sp. LaA6.9]